jgi:hypothetical protein
MTKANPARGRVGHLPHQRRNSIYAVSAGVWATGVLWLLFHYFVKTTDKFGFESPHPLEHWWLIGHAAFAFLAIWYFGILWPGHVKKSWTLKIRRGTGGVLFGFTAWLILTGFVLYYVGSDFWRNLTSLAHWIPGVVALVAFLVHLLTRTPRGGRP